MSFQGLSDLHIIPAKQTVSAIYYLEEIVQKTCVDALNRKSKKGDIFSRKLLPILKILEMPMKRRNFVYRTINRYKETCSLSDKPRSGRPVSGTTKKMKNVVGSDIVFLSLDIHSC